MTGGGRGVLEGELNSFGYKSYRGPGEFTFIVVMKVFWGGEMGVDCLWLYKSINVTITLLSHTAILQCSFIMFKTLIKNMRSLGGCQTQPTSSGGNGVWHIGGRNIKEPQHATALPALQCVLGCVSKCAHACVLNVLSVDRIDRKTR